MSASNPRFQPPAGEPRDGSDPVDLIRQVIGEVDELSDITGSSPRSAVAHARSPDELELIHKVIGEIDDLADQLAAAGGAGAEDADELDFVRGVLGEPRSSKEGAPGTKENRGTKSVRKKAAAAKNAKLPIAEVPLGDFDEMEVELVDWRPDSSGELKQCTKVANRIAAMYPTLDDPNWPDGEIRMDWSGKVKKDGEVKFERHNDRVYLGLQEPWPAVRRKALLISAIYLGSTQQTWD